MIPDPIKDLLKKMAKHGLKARTANSEEIAATADFHVCSDNPAPGVENFSTTCVKCGAIVYFSEQYPGLKKICLKCAMALGETENIVSRPGIERALNIDKRN